MANSPTPKQLAHMRHLASIGYLPTLETIAKRMSAPFWWLDPDLPRGIRGGTICFVHTGARLLGVTAAHVHTEYLARRAVVPGLRCQIGGHSFNPEERLIALDPELDVATYGLSGVQVTAALADTHYAPKWPPDVNDEDAHVVGGWPWTLSEQGDGEVTHSFLHFIAKLSSVSTRQMGIVTYTSTSIPWGGNSLPLGTNLGGMSGGPVYRMSESGFAVLTLVGTIYEYQPGFEIALARPLSVIDEQGTIS